MIRPAIDRGGGSSDPGKYGLSKEFEENVKQKLLAYNEQQLSEIGSYKGNSAVMRFTSMNKYERRRVHELCLQFGLHCRCTGREPHRLCEIKITKPNRDMYCHFYASDTEPLVLAADLKAKIRSYMQEYPIRSGDIRKYLSQPLHKGRSEHYTDDPKYYQRLVPPMPSPKEDIMRFRESLPTAQFRDEILHAIKHHQVILITGGTGCGKTTQIPQFILEDAADHKESIRMVCTQPRRLPAIAIAERVARERDEKVGETVGYHIRLEQKTSTRTVLTYSTSGVLLRMLMQDEVMNSLSHIILDEIHEREQNTDYLLIALKQAVRKRTNLKIIMMSATMEGNLTMFKEYFDKIAVKHIDIPARLYPVDKFFLGDVLAITGYSPAPSVFNGFSSFSMNGNVGWCRMSQWVSTSRMPEAQTAPNLCSLNMPQQHPAKTAEQTVFENVAQQLASMPAPTFGPAVAPPNDFSQPPPAYHPIPSYSHSNYDHHYNQSQQYTTAPQQPGFSQGQVEYGTPSQSSAWTAHGSQDIVEMPSNDVHPEIVDHPYRTYGGDVQPASDHPPWHASSSVGNQNPSWHHTQSFAGVTQQSSLHYQANMPPLNYGTAPHDQMYQNAGQARFHIEDGPSSYPMEYYNHLHHSASVGHMPSQSGRPGETDYEKMLRSEEEQRTRMMLYAQSAIPDRPKVFDPCVKELLRRKTYTSDLLVSNYLNLMGKQDEEIHDPVDVQLIFGVISYLLNSSVPGSILVFLTGYEDITQVREKLDNGQWGNGIKPMVVVLHSQVSNVDQQRVFEHCPRGYRKIILSTNIAEASLTIDDVVFVIDTGKVKEKSYDHEQRFTQLKTSWIARSNAEQRSGRAGRCQPGYCFRLYSENCYANKMASTQTAEMQRVAIHNVCLHAKMYAPSNQSVQEFLALAPERPSPEAVIKSMAFLEQIGALYTEETGESESDKSNRERYYNSKRDPEPKLTGLGRLIAQLPVDPQIARLLLFGVAFKCLAPVVTLAAALSYRDPFVLAHADQRDRAHLARDKFAKNDLSDHLALLRACNEFELHQNGTMAKRFCQMNFLSCSTMMMIMGVRKQLLGELRRCNLISICDRDPLTALNDPVYNKYSTNWPMVQACIVAGCYPGIGFSNNAKLRKIRTCGARKNQSSLHPSSVIKRQVSSLQPNDENCPNIEFLVYQEMAMIDEGCTLKTVTVVPPTSIMLCAGAIRLPKAIVDDFQLEIDDDVTDSEDEGSVESFQMHMAKCKFPIVELEDWLGMRGSFSNLQRLMQIRVKVMSYFIEVLDNPSIVRGSKDIKKRQEYDNLLHILSEVLNADHKRSNLPEVNDVILDFRRQAIESATSHYREPTESSINHSVRNHPINFHGYDRPQNSETNNFSRGPPVLQNFNEEPPLSTTAVASDDSEIMRVLSSSRDRGHGGHPSISSRNPKSSNDARIRQFEQDLDEKMVRPPIVQRPFRENMESNDVRRSFPQNLKNNFNHRPFHGGSSIRGDRGSGRGGYRDNKSERYQQSNNFPDNSQVDEWPERNRDHQQSFRTRRDDRYVQGGGQRGRGRGRGRGFSNYQNKYDCSNSSQRSSYNSSWLNERNYCSVDVNDDNHSDGNGHDEYSKDRNPYRENYQSEKNTGSRNFEGETNTNDVIPEDPRNETERVFGCEKDGGGGSGYNRQQGRNRGGGYYKHDQRQSKQDQVSFRKEFIPTGAGLTFVSKKYKDQMRSNRGREDDKF